MSDEIKSALASESAHWYTKQGAPMYEVEAKNGSMRPTTLADARKLDLVPSVTTILACAAKPGLDAWKARQLLEAALTLPMQQGESLDDYASRVIEDSKAQGRKAAEKGTNAHATIEEFIKGKRGESELGEFWEHAYRTHESLLQYGIDITQGKPEHSFASPLGYGGKIDWHNDEIVLDFKTKANLSAKQLAYPEHCWQLAAYSIGLFGEYEPIRRLINVFIGVEDCQVKITEWQPEDCDNAWEAFDLLRKFWQLTKNWNGTK